jgi:hypothetical protein
MRQDVQAKKMHLENVRLDTMQEQAASRTAQGVGKAESSLHQGSQAELQTT